MRQCSEIVLLGEKVVVDHLGAEPGADAAATAVVRETGKAELTVASASADAAVLGEAVERVRVEVVVAERMPAVV